MFLEPLLRRNRQFVDAAVELHRSGVLPANSYVLDLDAVGHNARVMREQADRLGLKVLAMTKQVGRNPAFLRTLRDAGITSAVAVDMECARAVHREKLELGHIGHLVQVPRAEAPAAAALHPAYWTVFSIEKARDAATASLALGRTQDILARIYAPGDTFYSGHEGGFPAEEIEHVAAAIDALNGARFAGITTFPALLYDAEAQKVVPTPNLATLAAAAARIGGAEVNAPGTTSSVVLEALAEHGATQVEPGHGLTGTTPLHAVKELPELPAVLYLTEVSHHYAGRAYCFGGGMYVDPVFPPYPIRAYVDGELVDAMLPDPSTIDYYGQLFRGERPLPAQGETVVFGFRIQAFVTRAYVTAISGVADGRPHLDGIWNVHGEAVNWP